MKLFMEEFGPVTVNDIVRMLLGKGIGAGIHRTVFEHGQDKTLVVKLENEAGSFANPQEWEVWERIRETSLAKWFAPCVAISGAGAVLFQKRTEPVTLTVLRAELPQVPVFFTDLKVSNWGRFDGRIVCHDYANHLLYEKGMTGRMRKADWWE
jgi:hypothetical protein